MIAVLHTHTYRERERLNSSHFPSKPQFFLLHTHINTSVWECLTTWSRLVMLHISNKSSVVRAVTAWGFHLILCARNRVLCLCTPERKAKTREESRKAERYWGRRIKKAKQPSLIEYNCVYEWERNVLRVAQGKRKLLSHESRWLDLHSNLVHSHSGTVTGPLEQITTHWWTADGKSK